MEQCKQGLLTAPLFISLTCEDIKRIAFTTNSSGTIFQVCLTHCIHNIRHKQIP